MCLVMYRYFSSVDKLPKLLDPTGSLSMKVLSFWLMRELRACWKSLLAKGNGAMSSCRPMSRHKLKACCTCDVGVVSIPIVLTILV